MVQFPGRPEGFSRPQRFEADVFDCEVVGALPSDLNGGFYRLHSEFFYPPRFADEAGIAGDGYMSLFRFKDGVVDYKGRWVRNERFENQLAARRQLYGYYRNPYTDDPEVRFVEAPGRRTTTNTTPVVFAGKLYATKEDGLAHELDPNTLETRGPTDFDGRWKSQTFTAHPKIDPETGEMVAFGYEASGLAAKDIFMGVFDRSGALVHDLRFDVPHVTMLHDMCITERHVVIPSGGVVTDLERLKAGQIHWGYDGSLPSYYGIIPRDGEARDVRWFLGPERSTIHTINAWTEGDTVVMEAPMSDGNYWRWFNDGKPFEPLPHTIRRWTFDLNSRDDSAKEEVLFAERPITSFTRIDERFMGRPYRYTWAPYADAERPFDRSAVGDHAGPVNNCYGRFDLRGGTMKTFFAGDTHTLMEASFIPRAGSAEEGDGYLLGVANNLKERRSELIVIDAERMQEVARVLLPFRSSGQVHGVWAGEGDLPFA